MTLAYAKNKDGKYTAIQLVMKFFGANMQEMKELPVKDREELASAIARQENIPTEELSFAPVPY
jgi:hypothetical protein